MLLDMLLALAAQLCGHRQNGILFTEISKETEADNARFFDNSATAPGSGQGLMDAAATRDQRD